MADATNAQVFWFSVVEFVVLFASVGYQVFNITRMFEGTPTSLQPFTVTVLARKKVLTLLHHHDRLLLCF